MNLNELLVDLSGRGVKMWAADGELHLRAPKGVLTPDLQRTLSEHKAELLELLKDQRVAEQSMAVPLAPVPRDGGLLLSFMQERLWFLTQMHPGSAVYNLPNARRMGGALDVDALRAAIEAIVERHEILRTTFEARDGQAVQTASPSTELDFDIVDLSGHVDPEAEADRAALAEAERPFDLATGPLLRVKLLRLGPEDHLFLWYLHHIVSDGWSSMLFLRELKAVYEQLTTGVAADLPELPLQFADFASWERRWLRGEVLEAQLSYWRVKLGGNLPVLELPADHRRPAILSYGGRCRSLTFSKLLVEDLKALAQRSGTTLFMVLLAAFKILLHRYTGQRDICVGSPIARRNRPEIEDLIGCFINTLVLRTDLSGDPSVTELLERVRETCTEAFGRQDVPFEKLVEELQPERDTSHTPLFQVMFTLHVQDTRKVSAIGDVEISALEYHAPTSKFDLTLELKETEDGLEGWFEYSTELFEEERIGRMVEQLRTLLEGIVAEPEQRVSVLPLLPAEERRRLLVEWNQTEADYPHESCIHELFEAQAERTPEGVAVMHEGVQLTFRELNRQANALAHHLRGLGVGPEVLVGLCVERSPEMVVGLLGILKAGGAYVPLDPSYPADRLSFMLTDTEAGVLLTQTSLREMLPSHGGEVVCLDAFDVTQRPAENPRSGVAPDNLAYVLYTSGSTGTPKGVMATHRGSVNRFAWMWREYPFGDAEVCAQKTALSFVDCVWEVFGPLLQGVPLVIIPDDIVKDPQRLIGCLAEQRVTRIVLVPSLLASLLESEAELGSRLPELRVWITSGEALSGELYGRFRDSSPEAVLLNLYGSSEVAADVTYFDTRGLEESIGAVPIGHPIGNTQIILLDVHGQLVPTGVPGELYVGGEGLARGYFKEPEQTAERFVAHPFSERSEARLYRTGDLARWSRDGVLEYLGRVDHQVKIRGFRIELGEIESVLMAHPAVCEAVVMAREDVPGDKRLVAYLQAEGSSNPSVGELRAHLKQKLPEYMVPTAYVELEAFPLTPNGKVDRRALLAPEQSRPELEASYVPPRTPAEERVAAIWSEVLGIERVGVHDSFFDLGGHSLMATRVISRLHDAFGTRLPVLTLFEQPTVAGVAEVLVGDQIALTDDEEMSRMLDELESS